LIAFGSLLKSWNFDKYKTKKDEKVILSDLQFFTADINTSENNFKPFRNLAESIFLTRLVVSEPANVIYPESLAEIARNELLPLGVDVEILNKSDMAALNMNALLGVAQGSVNEPKLVLLSWNKAKKSDKPIAFIGKGVTFDSGGISLKPSEGMEDMRHDMAGSGAILGLMKAVALNKLPVNVIGVMALVENMPSGTAQRPGDIVKSMSGQTIEVLNTDAEGRLILADALWYTQDRFKPKAMIDLATLTGAIVVALGHEFAGLFSNNDKLVAKINRSAEKTGEKVWRLPMTDNFNDGINSDIADVRNTGKSNVRGSSITAAHFLMRFVNNVPWAHIDIAGVESTSNDLFIAEKGATGFGVHLLYDFLNDISELTL
jgi:leucyl aminopeptidase